MRIIVPAIFREIWLKPSRNPVTGEWLLRFNRAGVPLNIFYYPKEEDPAVLPELITKEMIYNLLKKLNI